MNFDSVRPNQFNSVPNKISSTHLRTVYDLSSYCEHWDMVCFVSDIQMDGFH